MKCITEYMTIDRAKNLENEIKRIKQVAQKHDTGQREYGSTDWDYVNKICDRVLKNQFSENGAQE